MDPVSDLGRPAVPARAFDKKAAHPVLYIRTKPEKIINPRIFTTRPRTDVLSAIPVLRAKGTPMADAGFQAVHTIPTGGIQITAGSEADIAMFLNRLMGSMGGLDARNLQHLPTYSVQEAAERGDEYVDLLGRIAASLESIELVMKGFVAKGNKGI